MEEEEEDWMVVVVVVVVEIDNMVVEIDNNDQHDGWNEEYFTGQAIFLNESNATGNGENKQITSFIDCLSFTGQQKRGRNCLLISTLSIHLGYAQKHRNYYNKKQLLDHKTTEYRSILFQKRLLLLCWSWAFDIQHLLQVSSL